MKTDNFTLSLTSTQQIYLMFALLAVHCQPGRWFFRNCHMKQISLMEIIPRCNKITTNHHAEVHNLCQDFSFLFQDSVLLSQLNSKTRQPSWQEQVSNTSPAHVREKKNSSEVSQSSFCSKHRWVSTIISSHLARTAVCEIFAGLN